jgi:signal transduction histidine kinase
VRERIGIDLHDDLGPTLSFLKMKLGQLRITDNEAKELVDFCKKHFDEVISRIRSISFNMVPRTLQRQGMDAALKELIHTISDSGIEVNYRYEAGIINHAVASHIYRMTQEILNNVLKHAHATIVDLSFIRIRNILEIRIKDNGAGFNKKEIVLKRKGLGLENITSRASLLHGSIYLTTDPGKGVDYLIQIPCYD